MRRHRNPVILQMDAVECGAACLAMVLNHFGRKTRLAECRSKCDPGRNGISVLTIVEAAREFGLRTRAFLLRVPDFSEVPLPSIIHWNGNHFVLLWNVGPARRLRSSIQPWDAAGCPLRTSRQRSAVSR